MVMLLVFFSERSRSDLGQAIKTRPPNRCCWRCCSYCCCCGFCYAPMPALTQAIPIPIPIPRSDTHAPRWRRSVCNWPNVLCLRLRLRLSVCLFVPLSICPSVGLSHRPTVCLSIAMPACLLDFFSVFYFVFLYFVFCFFFSLIFFLHVTLWRELSVCCGELKSWRLGPQSLELRDWETQKLRLPNQFLTDTSLENVFLTDSVRCCCF